MDRAARHGEGVNAARKRWFTCATRARNRAYKLLRDAVEWDDRRISITFRKAPRHGPHAIEFMIGFWDGHNGWRYEWIAGETAESGGGRLMEWTEAWVGLLAMGRD